jgi:hypothetical protein
MSEKPQLSSQSAAIKRRLAENEDLFKHRNDAIKSALKGMIPELEGSRLRIDFYCECHNVSCSERIGLLLMEYEHAHRQARHFVVKPGHLAEGEAVVVRHHHYWVIEKPASAGFP